VGACWALRNVSAEAGTRGHQRWALQTLGCWQAGPLHEDPLQQEKEPAETMRRSASEKAVQCTFMGILSNGRCYSALWACMARCPSDRKPGKRMGYDAAV